MIMPQTTAGRAGKRSPIKSGTATAAGVPKPAAPSMNDPKSHATMMTWMRRSGEMPTKPARTTARPPLSFITFNNRMAPKMMYNSPIAVIPPFTVAAAT